MGESFPGAIRSKPRERTRAKLAKGNTTPVGAYRFGVSPYGAYDMAGNVLEWTSSLWGVYPANSVPPGDNSAMSSNRVLRGGSWYQPAAHARAVYRFERVLDVDFGNNGFRLALS